MLTSMLARCAGAAIALMVVTVCAMSGPLPSAQASTPAPNSASTAVLAQGVGMSGGPSVRVRRLQRILERAGFHVGPPGVDGRFGTFTAAAVRRMQNAYGLAPDGIAGPKTRRVVALIADRQRLRRQRTHDGSDTARPRAPRPSATSPTRPPRTTPAQPTPERPTATTAGTPAQRTDTTVPILLSVLAVLLAAAAVATTLIRGRRPRDGAALVGVSHDLYLEGHSLDERVGRFRGYALATAVPPGGPGDGGEERYLVDDPRKPTPVWVSRSDIRRSPSQLRPGETVLGYVTADDNGAREHEQFITIEEACARAGLELKEIIRDEDRPRMSNRPGLTRALEEIAAGRARGLVIAEVRRAARSVAALGSLVGWFRDAEAILIALDLELDTSTVSGRQTAATLIALAEWERSPRSRTRSGLASVKSPQRAGPEAGPSADERVALIQRISAMGQAGMTLEAIADQLNNEGVPALGSGAQWRPSAVQAALARARKTGREQLPRIARRERDA
jgi:DNA invertase Pin-like site-specific DNA recombinase